MLLNLKIIISKFLSVLFFATLFSHLFSCARQVTSQSVNPNFNVETRETANTDNDSILIYGSVVKFSEGAHNIDAVKVIRYDNTNIIVAASFVKNGNFEFKVPKSMRGTQVLVIFYNKLQKSRGGSNFKRFMIEGDSIYMVFDENTKKVHITGGIQNLANDVYTLENELWSLKKGNLKDKKAKGVISSETYREKKKELDSFIKKEKVQFVKSHPYAWKSLDILQELMQNYMRITWVDILPEGGEPLKEYKKIFYSLDKPVQEKGQNILKMIQNMEARRVPYFTGEMPDGNTFDLADMKGKVVLIDFWGSWCGWCRKAHPHLKELYAKYKDKGFEIIGVGVEHEKTREEKWQKFRDAIAEDGITWPQMLVDRNKQDIPAEYGVITYPSSFLLDRDGRLILRVGGTDINRVIDAKLDELFSENSISTYRSKELYESDMSLLHKEHGEVYNKIGELAKAVSGVSEEEKKAVINEFLKLEGEMLKKHTDFVSKHPEAPFSLDILKDNSDLFIKHGDSTFRVLHSLYKGLSGKVRALDTDDALGDYLKNYANTSAGEKFVPFSFVNNDGRTIDMNNLKGKVILLDFWGSWCFWCRKLDPHLKELYSKYKDEGFEIVGIAFEYGTKEEQIQRWKEAIEKDETPWLHALSDVDGRDLIKEYAIKEYPSLVLIDKQGIIVSRSKDLNGLKEKIEELLKT
ncbi:TlpA disulfide reductase family protein [Flavivirga sp. 57AJ16]|uniref:TlpA disulfide reductase family protein n=1 Tax=Flavivirga sp. 57AJ16 TaxID=3025307 RepID=UPI002364FE35|nr:TlpA disulfide reductase family protein [Flavivirga sp. 57AJ16]MDD7886790.1 TlpA disulfide reductase family protein [Flavivirga sp. 57AJ16]